MLFNKDHQYRIMKSRTVIQSMRGPFLVLTPACVFLGVSTVVASQTSIDLHLLVLVLLGAVLAHISVNTLNEYSDFKSGLDLVTKRTRFSGGSGALPRNPEMAPGIGFGFLMVVGTQFVLEGKFSTLSWLVAVVPFFLVNNLLLLNQYPDIQADADAGRNHLPIAYGTTVGNRVYALFILATIMVISTCILGGYFPALSLIALLPVPLAFFSLGGAIKYGEAIGDFPQYLGANVAVAILTPLLLGVSLMAG
jgi:1,4-dihydroxy-2-naphthoate octaprenyltransferase